MFDIFLLIFSVYFTPLPSHLYHILILPGCTKEKLGVYVSGLWGALQCTSDLGQEARPLDTPSMKDPPPTPALCHPLKPSQNRSRNWETLKHRLQCSSLRRSSSGWHVSAFTSHGTDVSNRESGEVKESGLRDVGQIEAYLRTERGGNWVKCLRKGKGSQESMMKGRERVFYSVKPNLKDDLNVGHFCHNHFN